MTTLISRLLLASISLSSMLFLPIGSCDTRDWQRVECNAYVQQYYEIDGIELSGPHYNNDLLHCFNLRFSCEKSCKFTDVGENKTRYDSLRNVHGDIVCTTYATVYEDGTPKREFGGFQEALYPIISQIDVVSNIDFDAEHPAGTSLNDCIEIYFEQINLSQCDKNFNSTLLSKWNQSKWLITSHYSELRFIKYPNSTNIDIPHTFTVCITTANGKTYTTTQTAKFKLKA